MRKKMKLVYGVGVNDSQTSIYVDGKQIKSYNCWKGMLERCYSKKLQIKFPTYLGCSVCEDWLYFSNFKLWYNVNYKEGFEVDKDILIQGNKIYSPATCRFVPKYINLLLTDSGRARGIWPLGVRKREDSNRVKPYMAKCCDGFGNRIQESFATLPEAVKWYSVTKTRIVKQQADRALAANDIDISLFMSLVSRKF